MEGSLYPDGILIDRSVLRRTELTKSNHILMNRRHFTSRGIYSGGEITINLVDDKKIDVKQLTGFAPNGEYISTTSDYFSIALDDYTNDVMNYVCAVYTESNIYDHPHETNGKKYPTYAKPAWRIRVFSETNFNALPYTDNNLANNSRDRCLLIGKVKANGIGISLTSSDVYGPTEYNNILYAVPMQPPTIKGVTIHSISPNMPVGDGLLEYRYSTGPITYEFRWTSSTGGTGSWVTVASDGYYNFNDGTGEFIRCLVALSLLPTVVGTISDVVTIFNLYYQDVPRLTAEDLLHRNMIGTGVVTPNNPHGTGWDDIAGESITLLDEHQDIQHCNGIVRWSSANMFVGSISPTAVCDTLQIVSPISGDLYYINGRKLDSLDSDNITFNPAPVETSLYDIYVSDETALGYSKRLEFLSRNIGGIWAIDISDDFPAGTYPLVCDVAVGPPLSYTFSLNGGKSVSIFYTDTAQTIRLYDKDGINWIDLWVRTNATGPGDGFLPGVGTHTDNISINAAVDWNDNMKIISLPYWYNSAIPKGLFGFPPYSGTRLPVDRRKYGNTCIKNMADEALEYLSYSHNDELHHSGVLLRRNGDFNEFRFDYPGSGFSVYISGGSYYCRGRRITISGDNVSLPASSNMFIYADAGGVIRIANITTSFVGNKYDAMKYILGSSMNIPNIDDVTHFNDNIDPPERGVILWYVETDASDVIVNKDYSRNINGAVDDWSVAKRDSQDSILAAFDSLHSVFDYANVSINTIPKSGVNVTVNVIGNVDIDSEVIQYSGIDVVGNRNTNIKVNVTYVDLFGAWKLSNGCRVSGLNIENNADNGAVFGLNDEVIIERCCYVRGSATIDYFASLNNGTTGINRVNILNNFITTVGGMFSNVIPAVNGYSNFDIMENNIILEKSIGPNAAIHMDSSSYINIKRNSIYVIDSDDKVTSAIAIINTGTYQTINIDVIDNSIRIGNESVTKAVPEIGIFFSNVSFSEVRGNNITRMGASTIGMGLWLGGCLNVSVNDNKFTSLGIGIIINDFFYDVEIYNNKFAVIGHRGIFVNVLTYPLTLPLYGNSVYGLRIEENDMYGFIKAGVFGTGWDGKLIGVDIDLSTLAGANASVNGISINRNIMGVFTSTTGDVCGIRLSIDTNSNTKQDTFSISENQIYDFLTGDYQCHGIDIRYNSSTGYNIDGSSINGNIIKIFTNTKLVNVAGIRTIVSFNRSEFCNNLIEVESYDNIHTDNGSGIMIDVDSGFSQNLLISDNNIVVNKSGISVSCIMSKISDNRISSLGVGIFVRNGEGTIVSDNNITVRSYNGNIYCPAYCNGGGSYCIVTERQMIGTGVEKFIVKNNNCLLYGVGLPKDLFGESACIYIDECAEFEIDGNETRIETDTIAGYGGVPPDPMAYHIFFRIDGNIYNKYTFEVKNCYINNYDKSSGICNGLFIDVRNWNKDLHSCRGHISNNTWKFKIVDTGGNFNWEGWPGSGAPGAAAANYPYEIYLHNFDQIGAGNKTGQIVFTSNSLYKHDDSIEIPKVYLGLFWRSNLTNYADNIISGGFGQWW